MFEDDDEPFFCSHADVMDDFQQMVLNFTCLSLQEKVRFESHLYQFVILISSYYISSLLYLCLTFPLSFEIFYMILLFLRIYKQSIRRNSNTERILDIIHRYFDVSPLPDQTTDKFGFHVDRNNQTNEVINDKDFYLESVFTEMLNCRALRAWNSSAFNNGDNIKWLVREVGIPNEMRHQIWLSIIKNKSDPTLDVSAYKCIYAYIAIVQSSRNLVR